MPESVGAPSPARAFSTPPAKGKDAQIEEKEGRVYETIAFGGFGRPIDGTMEEVRDSVRSSKLKRSKSKRSLSLSFYLISTTLPSLTLFYFIQSLLSSKPQRIPRRLSAAAKLVR